MLTLAPTPETTRWRSLTAPLAVVGAAGLACAAIALGDPTTPGGPLPVCPTAYLLGIDCPGCGSMRMVYSLLHGDLAAAARFNAVALVALPLLALAFVTWTVGRWRGRRVEALAWQRSRWAPLVALAVFSTWFVIRNLPFEPFTHLRV